MPSLVDIPPPNGTSHAMVHGKPLASNLVIEDAPDFPSIKFFQEDFVSPPSGVTAPTPVITTLRNKEFNLY